MDMASLCAGAGACLGTVPNLLTENPGHFRRQRQSQRPAFRSPPLVRGETKGSEISSTPQVTTAAQSPMASAFEKKDIRKVDPGFYETPLKTRWAELQERVM